MFEGAFVFFPGRGQIRVLEPSQQLPFVNLASPVDVELSDWCADLRYDGRLLQRKQHGIRNDDALNGCFLDARGGDGNGRFFGFLVRAAGEHHGKRTGKNNNQNRKPGNALAGPGAVTDRLLD